MKLVGCTSGAAGGPQGKTLTEEKPSKGRPETSDGEKLGTGGVIRVPGSSYA